MIRNLILSFAFILLAGCAAPKKQDNFASRVEAQGSEYSKLAKQWEKGDALITEGLTLSRKGENEEANAEKALKRAKAKQKDGEAMVRKGKKLKAEAVSDYEKITGKAL